MKITPFIVIMLTTLVTGCASINNTKDPLEGFNRAMFSVNEHVDSVVLKPIATGYDYVAPKPLKLGVSNFFGNLGDIPNMANNLLQGEFKSSISDLGRLIVNTTLGIGGLFDVASEMGIDKNDQDFGQTLAKWGIEQGAYIYLPLIGPSNIRDLSGKTVDLSLFDPVGHIKYIPTRNMTYGLRINDTRYRYLSTGDAIDMAAIDKYTYIRDAYAKMRYYQIYNKQMPLEDDSVSDTNETDSTETDNTTK